MLAAASIKVMDALFGFPARNDAECCKRELLGRSWRRDWAMRNFQEICTKSDPQKRIKQQILWEIPKSRQGRLRQGRGDFGEPARPPRPVRPARLITKRIFNTSGKKEIRISGQKSGPNIKLAKQSGRKKIKSSKKRTMERVFCEPPDRGEANLRG